MDERACFTSFINSKQDSAYCSPQKENWGVNVILPKAVHNEMESLTQLIRDGVALQQKKQSRLQMRIDNWRHRCGPQPHHKILLIESLHPSIGLHWPIHHHAIRLTHSVPVRTLWVMASVRWEEEEEVDEEEEEGTQSRKPTHNNKRNVKCQVHQIKQTAGRISSRAPGVCAFHLAETRASRGNSLGFWHVY